MMHFKTSKHTFTVIFLWVAVLALAAVLFVSKDDLQGVAPYLVNGIVAGLIGLLVWLLLDTRYRIDGNEVYYYSGPIRGKIDILTIRKIENLKTWHTYSLLKPLLASKDLSSITTNLTTFTFHQKKRKGLLPNYCRSIPI